MNYPPKITTVVRFGVAAPEGSSGSLVARITLGGCHPKLQTPLAAADVRGRVATVAGGALAGDVVAALSVVSHNWSEELEHLLDRFGGYLAATADRISDRLGFQSEDA